MNINKHIEAIWPIKSITDSGIIINKNCDISVIIKVQFPEVFCTTEDNYLNIYEAFLQAVKSLGEGYIIHKQDIFIEDKYKKSNLISDDIIEKAMDEHFDGRPIFQHKSYIIITWPNADPTKRDSLASSLYRAFRINPDLLKKDTESIFWAKVRSFKATLNGTKLLESTILDKSQIFSKDEPGIYKNYFSLSFKDKTLNDIEMGKGLKINEKYTQTRVINSIEQFPNQLHPINIYGPYSTEKTSISVSMGMALGLNLQFNHVYNQIFIVLKQKDLKSKLVSEIKQHNAFAAWSSDNEMAIEAKTKFNNTLASSNAIAVKAHFNVMCFHENEQQTQRYGEELDSAISSIGFVPKRATTYAEQLFWTAIPGNASEIGKDNLSTLFLDNALSLCCLESNYRDGFFG